MVIVSSWKLLNVHSKPSISGPFETFRFNPTNSLSRSTRLLTPLKFGEVKWIIQGPRKLNLHSNLNPLTPNQSHLLPSSGDGQAQVQGPLWALHSDTLFRAGPWDSMSAKAGLCYGSHSLSHTQHEAHSCRHATPHAQLQPAFLSRCSAFLNPTDTLKLSEIAMFLTKSSMISCRHRLFWPSEETSQSYLSDGTGPSSFPCTLFIHSFDKYMWSTFYGSGICQEMTILRNHTTRGLSENWGRQTIQ